MGTSTSTETHTKYNQEAILCPATYMNTYQQCVKTPPGAQCLSVNVEAAVQNYITVKNGQVVKDATGKPALSNYDLNVRQNMVLPGDGTIGTFDLNKPCQLK
jgi:hypothetical protein